MEKIILNYDSLFFLRHTTFEACEVWRWYDGWTTKFFSICGLHFVKLPIQVRVSPHVYTHTIICGIHHTHLHSQLPNHFLKEISLKSEDYIIAFYRNYIIIFLKLKIWTYMILWIIRITSSPLISLLTCCGSLFYTWKIINQTLFLFKWNPVQAWSNKMTVAI
jgi:hypothetical protein